MLIFILIVYFLELSSGGLRLTSIESEEARPWFDLVELGSNITQIIDKPAGPGHKFVRDVFVYWENLEYVLDSIKNNETRGLEVYKRIKSHGGPPHVDVTIDDDLLLKSFNWTKRDIYEIRETINDTKIIWADIQTYLKTN